MKSTERFKNTIKAYLDIRASEDELFSITYAKANKNINDCITYILNEVKENDCNGFADDEIYSMAVHYYDEDNIDIGNKINCRIVVNHTVELTEEEKEEARKEAIKQATDEAYRKMTQPKKNSHKQTEVVNTANLFNF